MCHASWVSCATRARDEKEQGMPNYTVKVLKFKAVDESGIDWTGSDEPLWVFTAKAGGRVSTSRSKEFGDGYR
jgi:hypothetical protein